MTPYLAHRTQDGREQTILAHALGVAGRAAEFAALFHAGDLARVLGLAHDLGKYSENYQHYLRLDPEVRALRRGSVVHSSAGALELYRRGLLLLAGPAAGHHGGLPDYGEKNDGPDKPTLLGRLKKRPDDYSPWAAELTLPPAAPPAFCQSDPFTASFLIRMLYSCLVDADFLDTETFMQGAPADRGGGPGLCALRDRLLENIGPWLENRESGTLNGRRSAVLRACLQAAEDPAPLRTLTVPTGGGKTAASLAYALAHGAKFGKTRVIYVIPYTSIIEQTAQRFRDWLGEEAVLEHHSGIDYAAAEGEEADPALQRKALAAENWDAPVVVTTSVQFFESLYANRPSRCRKLHNLANSVVIFDEAQMFPLCHLRPCVAAVTQLAEHYGVTAVLCTATQPALGPLFREFAPGHPLSEIVPGTKDLYEALRRVTLRHLGAMDDESMANALNGCRQALCIVNSRAQARNLFSAMEGEGCFHLSTLMTPAHRRAVLEEVKRRLKDGEPCRLVSTSLIEAGVDVDFPVVYRAEAGLDSILQAAGRCNREGTHSPQESFVYIFSSPDGEPSQLHAQSGAFQTAAGEYEDLNVPEAITSYFETLRRRQGKESQDKNGILDAFARGIKGRMFPFAWVAEQFHLIDTPTAVVYVPLDPKSWDPVERLRSGVRSRNLFRELGVYGASVYPKHLAALADSGAVTLVEQDKAILNDMTLYDWETGLSLAVSGGNAIFA